MEPRFGRDFSGVRVHTDHDATESAREVHAHAYTVGNHVVFGAGMYAPSTPHGRKLLAHELAHVIQQSGTIEMSSDLPVHPAHDPAEHEADRMAAAALSPSRFRQAGRRAFRGVQRLLCDSILNAEEGDRVRGVEAERQIRIDFISQVGPRTTLFDIPGASAQPFRDEGCGGEGGEALGAGKPDLIYLNNRQVELAEIKIGTWPCVNLAEQQVGNYVAKGNDPSNSAWRSRMGISTVKLMPTTRFSPASVTVGQTPVTVGWCGPGVIVYKPIKRGEQQTFACGMLSDRGAIDRFLNKALDPAQTAVDRYISQVMQQLSKAIDEELAKRSLTTPRVCLKALFDTYKQKIVTMLREEVQKNLRQYLERSLATLCAAAAAKGVVSIKDLLDKLDRERNLILVPALIAVQQRLTKEMAEAVWNAVKHVVIAILIVAAAIVIFFLTRGAPMEEGPMRNPGFTPSPTFASKEPVDGETGGVEPSAANTTA